MKKIIPQLIFICLMAENTLGQKFISTYNQVSFYSEAPMENIEAHSYKAKSILDAENGEMAYSVPIRTFEFKKSLMQEHFNENFMESDQYPKATFKGKINDYRKQQGKQQVTATGDLEIHGVTHEVSVPGEIDFSDQEVKIKASFPVKVADYKIKIPSMVVSNIAEVVEVTIDFTYIPHENQ